MKGFIEVTNKEQEMKQLINLTQVESFTELYESTLIHFNQNNRVTVKETYEEIKQLIKKSLAD